MQIEQEHPLSGMQIEQKHIFNQLHAQQTYLGNISSLLIAIVVIMDVFAWYFLPATGFVLALIATSLAIVRLYLNVLKTKFVL